MSHKAQWNLHTLFRKGIHISVKWYGWQLSIPIFINLHTEPFGLIKKAILRCSLWQNLIYSAYPVNWGYANFQKNSMDVNDMHPEIKDQGMKVLWDSRGLLVLDLESKDMYRCHPYHFMEICKPQVNKPIGSYQIHHLKSFSTPVILIKSYLFSSFTW